MCLMFAQYKCCKKQRWYLVHLKVPLKLYYVKCTSKQVLKDKEEEKDLILGTKRKRKAKCAQSRHS